LNIDKYSAQYRKIGEAAEYLNRTTETYNTGLGETVKITNLWDKETKKVLETKREIIQDSVKAEKIHGQAIKDNIAFERKKLEEQIGLEKIHYQAIKDNIAFERKKLEEQIGLEKIHYQALRENEKFDQNRLIQQEKIADQIHKQKINQQELFNQVDKTVRLNEAAIKRGGLSKEYEDLQNAILNLDPTNKNFDKQLTDLRLRSRQLGTELSVVNKEIRDGSKFTNIFGQSILEAGKKFLGKFTSPVRTEMCVGHNTYMQVTPKALHRNRRMKYA